MVTISLEVVLQLGEGRICLFPIYADDTLIFCKVDLDQLKFLSWILMWFEAMAGLKINLAKSEIIPVGPVSNLAEMTSELGCKIGSLPTYYLGLPLGAKHKALGVWDSIEERYRKRLAAWKTQYISKGDRITLIRSTLSSLPIYYLSLFRMPQNVCARLEMIQRQFLWGGSAPEKKISLVRWATVCSEKRKGGIGLKSLSKLNKALLCKWSWRFANDQNALWRKTIYCKFGESIGGWHSRDLRGGYGTSLWKDIRKEWFLFFQNAAFVIGDGRRINFWSDVWCGGEALSDRFPTLFNLATNKEAKVAYIWDIREGDGCWSPTFLRALNDGEFEEMTRFLHTLHDQKLRPTGVDKISLQNVKDRGFSVKSMYKGVDVSPAFVFPHRIVWNPVVPPKIGVFVWEAAWGKVLTLDQLKRRGMSFANKCFMCEEEEETIDHLLIHCNFAKMLWNLFLSIVGISWVFPHSVLHTLLSWQGAAVGKKRRKIWFAAPLCLFWNLWRARNMVVFENEVPSAQRIKVNFVSNLWTWANLYSGDYTHSVIDFFTWLGSRLFSGGFLSSLLSVFWFPFVHHLCTLGFFCYLYKFAFYRSKKKYTQEGGRLSILVLASLSFVILLNASIMCCAAIKIVLFPYSFTFSRNDGACVIYLTFLGLS